MLDSSNYPSIKPTTIETINNYVNHGLEPGSFVLAVLSNNLFDAVGFADPQNLATLPEIVKYVYNETPFECWGNPNKVNAWMKKSRSTQGVNNEFL